MEAGETLAVAAGTININIAGLTAKAAPSPEDVIPVWDPAAAGYRRVTVASLPANGASAAATVADLRNLPVSEGAIAILSGRANGADGAGGVFCWDSGATDADNGATIIAKASSGIGRWKRLQTGAVNVRWFGAKGDGTTDDTAAFTAALSAGSVWVPNGTYRITSPLHLTGARTVSFESRNATLKYSGAGYCIDADGWRDGLLKNGTIDWSQASGSECGAVHLRCHLGSCAYNVIRDMTFIGGMTLADRAPGRYSIRLTGNVEQVAQTSPAYGFATYYNLVSHCRFYGADTHVRLVNGTGANPWTRQPNAFRSIANTYEAYIWGIWIDDPDEHLSIGDWFTGAFAIAGYGGTGSETDNRTYAYRLNGVYNQFVTSTVQAGDGATPGKFGSTAECELNRVDIISNCLLGWDNTIDNSAPTTIAAFVGLQPTQSLILHVADGYTAVTPSALLRVDNQPEGRTVPLAPGDVWMVTTQGGVVTMSRVFAHGGRESYGTLR
ncbi:MAG TPA: glycosyl hydrolase family 28-related protein, partial [Candidatus Defluviicoccus seviourii]|nr:glycosyl hydrolase family 28-related protein [Candidatus Defluviicoccus seviourii]